MNFDLSHITFGQFFIILLALAGFDLANALVKAASEGAVKLALLTDVIRTQVLPIVFPIGALAFIAQSVPQAQDAHQTIWLAACVGLALYLGKTAGSVIAKWQAPAVNHPVTNADAGLPGPGAPA